MKKCTQHKHYQGKNIPYSHIDCKECWAFYEYKHPGGMTQKEYKTNQKIKTTKEIKKLKRRDRNVERRKYKEKYLPLFKKIFKKEYYHDFIEDFKGEADEFALSAFRANVFLFKNADKSHIQEFTEAVHNINTQSVGKSWLKILKSNISALHYEEACCDFNHNSVAYSEKIKNNYNDYIITKNINEEPYTFGES